MCIHTCHIYYCKIWPHAHSVIPASQCSRQDDLLTKYLSCSHTLFFSFYLFIHPSPSCCIFSLASQKDIDLPAVQGDPGVQHFLKSFLSSPLLSVCLLFLLSGSKREGSRPAEWCHVRQGQSGAVKGIFNPGMSEKLSLSITASYTALGHQSGVFTHVVAIFESKL